MSADALIGGSDAQMRYFIEDAKSDIATLVAFVDRVAKLNPDAGEIGPGMLANIVGQARGIIDGN